MAQVVAESRGTPDNQRCSQTEVIASSAETGATENSMEIGENAATAAIAMRIVQVSQSSPSRP